MKKNVSTVPPIDSIGSIKYGRMVLCTYGTTIVRASPTTQIATLVYFAEGDADGEREGVIVGVIVREGVCDSEFEVLDDGDGDGDGVEDKVDVMDGDIVVDGV